MQHLESDIKKLRNELFVMWNQVISQLNKSKEALFISDKNLAREVILNEKRVNAQELIIDRDCELILALQTPVAIDLRFVLAALKINNNLERTGDIAEGIAKFIHSSERKFNVDLFEQTGVFRMFEEANLMMQDTLRSFETEDTSIARSIFLRDDYLDEINVKANKIIAKIIQDNPAETEQALYVLSIIRKLERIGDQCKNIAEEIIFFLEAKVLKHTKNK